MRQLPNRAAETTFCKDRSRFIQRPFVPIFVELVAIPRRSQLKDALNRLTVVTRNVVAVCPGIDLSIYRSTAEHLFQRWQLPTARARDERTGAPHNAHEQPPWGTNARDDKCEPIAKIASYETRSASDDIVPSNAHGSKPLTWCEEASNELTVALPQASA